MSVHKKADGLFEVRWREGGRQKSVRVRGFDVAKKVQHKKLTNRDENRHLDVKKEINYKMSDLIDRYWRQYGSRKASADREKEHCGRNSIRARPQVCTRGGWRTPFNIGTKI